MNCESGCCGGGGHHGHHEHGSNCNCGCGGNCSCGKGWRKFSSKREKKERLENYKQELLAELEAVNEILEKLQ